MTTVTETSVAVVPLADRVLVKPDSGDTVTKGGIVLPENAIEKPVQGTVLAVGPGRLADSGELIPVRVTAGETVIYSRYAGTEVQVDGESCLLLQERDLLAVIRANKD